MNNFSKHIDFEKRRMPDKSGLTVVELLVVIGIIAVVVAISLPAFNAMQKSFDSTGAEGMISAALSTARTLAISRQQYVGVRFQTSYDPADVLDEEQYMIFVIFDNTNNYEWVCGFVAIEGYKPMKLPSNIGVIDKRRNTRSSNACIGS
ncbi:MAG: prepilin-type N-terminal cleavage/methylation domain-containing protein [Phycisphaerae bacterium]|jgi:type II secretory pathway pseudopilin PulG